MTTEPSAGPPRRNILVSMLALLVGAIVSLFPFAAGAVVFLDPVLKKKKKGDQSDSQADFRKVAQFDNVPMDGTPIKVTVLADHVDAWNRDPDQPVGAIYLRRKSGTEIQAFNAICPHAGCFVAYSAAHRLFLCPCHNSAFRTDGEKTNFEGKTNPSPRMMDELETEVRQAEVWVKFQNFYPGQHEKEPKA